MKRAWFVVAALMIFVAGAIAQKAAQPEVKAERFVLVDHDGNKRAELGLDRTGEANLTFYDARGRAIWSARGPSIVPLREP